MATQRNIYLIGFMGTGKTTVGRLLARRLGLRFVDMDDVIVERAGKPIPRIFAEEGEPQFRALERAVAHELSQQAGWVVATGGGVVTDPRNMADFEASGLTVCLSARPDAILARVAGDTNRPLLSGSRDEKMLKMQALLDKRRALYAAVPHQVDTSTLTPEGVADRVEALYRGKSPLNIAVLGSGKGSNAQSIIDAIAAGSLNARIVCVLSDVEDAFILERARRHGIPARHISALPFKTKLDGAAETAYIAALREHGADMVALAGFMRIIKSGLLQAYGGRIVNIHPSLLPAFPGLAAWKQALDYGVKVAGCTVHLVDAGTDTGPILVQRAVPVLAGDTPETLHARIQEQEHLAYPEALRLLASRAAG